MARGDELLGDFLVAREALHLEERPLVPVDAEPLEALRIASTDSFVERSRSVSSMRSTNAAMAARVRPRESAVRAPPMCR